MEGLLDYTLRDALTRPGGIDLCVSEFIRVTGSLLPVRTFKRIIPELDNGGKTPAGVPVRGQLLGSDPACMADNAARLASLGPAGIDLNFGCPAKCVNRHGGGAMLLTEPDRLFQIARAVRAAVPEAMPVTAKMRLGFEDRGLMLDCALALQAGGAEELVVHGRTKRDGYKPPAYWDAIGLIRAAVNIPVVANGEIWTVDDWLRCKAESGCEDVMLGRGQVANPGLALALRHRAGAELSWNALQALLAHFWELVGELVSEKHRAGRLKQWLNYLRRHYPEAGELHGRIRQLVDPALVRAAVFGTP